MDKYAQRFHAERAASFACGRMGRRHADSQPRPTRVRLPTLRSCALSKPVLRGFDDKIGRPIKMPSGHMRCYFSWRPQEPASGHAPSRGTRDDTLFLLLSAKPEVVLRGLG
jgi:hypothetical protein